MESFQQRCDNQITTLEILAISVGLSTFCDKLAGRKVIVFGDNTGAEVSVSIACWSCWGAPFLCDDTGVSEEGRVRGVGSVSPHTRDLDIGTAKANAPLDRKGTVGRQHR